MDIPLFNEQIAARLSAALTSYNSQYHILTTLLAAILVPYLF